MRHTVFNISERVNVFSGRPERTGFQFENTPYQGCDRIDMITTSQERMSRITRFRSCFTEDYTRTSHVNNKKRSIIISDGDKSWRTGYQRSEPTSSKNRAHRYQSLQKLPRDLFHWPSSRRADIVREACLEYVAEISAPCL